MNALPANTEAALKRASEEARELGHPAWGSEHILLSLTGSGPGKGAVDTEHLLLGTLRHDKPESKVLRQLGATFEDVYRELTGQEPADEIRPERPVYVHEKDLAPLLRFLPEVLPAEVSYGFDFDDELAWFTSSSGGFEAYVRRALALARR